MKKEFLYVLGFLFILLVIFFIVRFFKVTDDKIISVAEMAISDVLHDPYSAQFSKIAVKKNSNEGYSDFYKVCGFVNSKNLYGAYTGNKPFIISVMATGSKTIKVVDGTLNIGNDSFTNGVINELCNE
ncbi:hypothetical protein [Providencia sp. PROV257]|uniref:hypothetical protein n=1 Tax=Providencia sp. PROV257 TaxID=2949945 RepID=UPI002349BAC3